MKWYHRPVWVLALLFVVLGPLGLPYLWQSPSFSRSAKIAFSVLVGVYTLFLVEEVIQVVHAMRMAAL